MNSRHFPSGDFGYNIMLGPTFKGKRLADLTDEELADALTAAQGDAMQRLSPLGAYAAIRAEIADREMRGKLG